MNTTYALLIALFLTTSALAAEPQSPDAAAAAERADVDAIKEKYWARGEKAEVGVVQHRTYSKERKIEIGIYGGITATDPFLNVQSLGGSLGYHFTEYLSVHAFGWKTFVQPSSALVTFQNTLGVTTNSNEPRYYIGAEGNGSFLYGKLSLVGKSIIYYDMHVLAGAGATGTESGTYFTPHVGIGQQVYIAKWSAIKVDYRLMPYNETILEKVRPSTLGQPIDQRVNWSHSLTLGISILFGGGGK